MRYLGLLLLLGPIVLLLSACADRPAITFDNHRDQWVDVHIDGDRVLILAPHTAEALPYQVAAWSWPRAIEARTHDDGVSILSFRASAGDLAEQNWRVDIR